MKEIPKISPVGTLGNHKNPQHSPTMSRNIKKRAFTLSTLKIHNNDKMILNFLSKRSKKRKKIIISKKSIDKIRRVEYNKCIL